MKQNNSSKSETDINNKYNIHSQKIEKIGLVVKNFFLKILKKILNTIKKIFS